MTNLILTPMNELIPDEFRRIGELIRTQNNRITDQPMFVVQQKREYVTDPDYNDARLHWRCDGNSDYADVSELRAERLELLYQGRQEVLEGYDRYHVMHVWEHVTSCFTEQGCKDYIVANGHNHRAELRIYAEGSYRNCEYQAVRNWLMSLAAPNEAQP